MSRERASGKPPRARIGREVTRARIVDAALLLIERDGLDGLTMRRLAAEVEIEAMSLYHYFASKDELLDAAVARVVAGISERPGGATWEERFRAQLRRYRAIAHARPQLFPLLGRRRAGRRDDPPEWVPAEWLLDDLRSAGLAPDDAFAIFQALMAYAHGFALMEISHVALDVRDVDVARFPRLHELAPHLARRDLDAEFERGLDLFVAGVHGRFPGAAAAQRRSRPVKRVST